MILQCNAAGYANSTDTIEINSTVISKKKLSKEEVFSLISELLNCRSSNEFSTNKKRIDNGDIVTALSLMQHNIDTLLFDNDSGEFRLDTKIISDFERLLHINMSSTMNKTDVDTIDVVRMMFDIIFEDKRLSNKTKTLLAKLQIPVLKVAFLDNAYFSDDPHPAERLINKLTDAAISLTKIDDNNSPSFYPELNAIVTRITNEFTDDAAIFSGILESSQLFKKEKQNKTNPSTQHLYDATEKLKLLSNRIQKSYSTDNIKKSVDDKSANINVKTISKNKLNPPIAATAYDSIINTKNSAHTNQLITNAIRKKIIADELPREVRDFLTTTWANVATRIYNDHSDKSEIWKTTISVVDQLAWIFQPKSNFEDKQKITNIIPRLVTNIQDGLDSTNSVSKNKTQLFATLLSIHAASLKEQRLARN
ncbi:MAG: DUF1631 domain-containing protein [Gammaproteobacteria bacterium]|nr:DUF1631 domain-containing protein [Gammaproteobacteria bacterium]